jgi:hypothetical protein
MATKMFFELIGLQYRILYKKGVENGAADALSRRPCAEVALFNISLTHLNGCYKLLKVMPMILILYNFSLSCLSLRNQNAILH